MSRFSGQFAAPLSPPIARQPAWTVIFASTKRATNRCGADIFRLPWRACRHGLFRPLQGSEALLYAARCGPCFALFLGSSAVEHSTVNRMVAGSNPARGASQFNYLAANRLPASRALSNLAVKNHQQHRGGPVQTRSDTKNLCPLRLWEAAGDSRTRGQCRSTGASGSRSASPFYRAVAATLSAIRMRKHLSD
jgi:hypothetical protein